MIISASKYALMREKKKIVIPSRLNEVDLKLASLRNQIANKRFEYENGSLSKSKREKMTKLEIKNKVKELDVEIELIKNNFSELREIFKLLKLNSSNISPLTKLKIDKKVREFAPKRFEE